MKGFGMMRLWRDGFWRAFGTFLGGLFEADFL
jgi:hypothetical protein